MKIINKQTEKENEINWSCNYIDDEWVLMTAISFEEENNVFTENFIEWSIENENFLLK
jgi:hypothetical protein